MGLKSVLRELKRRNIYKVAVAYGVTGWLVIQITSLAANAFNAPDWVTQMVIVLILLGFPVALVFAWAFEITPDGIKRTRDIPEEHSITKNTGRKLDFWIIAILSFLVVFLLADKFWLQSFGTTHPTGMTYNSKPSVAVLPFEDYSPEGDQQWFADGLTEEILNSLARLQELNVAARTSSFYFKDKKTPLPEIADTLNVEHIVEGSVRRVNDDLRVTAQLIRANDQYHLWSNTYDRRVDSVFAIQEDIAENIAEALDIYLDEEARKYMFATGTNDVEAFEAYVKGSQLYMKAHGGVDVTLLWDANKWFEKAIDIDPEYAAPYSKHQDPYTHVVLGHMKAPDTLNKQEAYEQIFRDLDNAVTYSNDPAIRIRSRLERAFLSNDWSEVPELIKQLKNNEKAQRICCGWVETLLFTTGHFDFFHGLYQNFARRNQISQRLRLVLSASSLALGRPDSALYYAEKTNYPNFNFYYSFMKLTTFLQTGKLDRAKKMARETPGTPDYVMNIIKGFEGRDVSGIDAITPPDRKAFAYFAAGNQEKVNQIAHAIDSTLLGPQKLSTGIQVANGLIYFDLSATPNFKARLEEAGVEVKPYNLLGRKAYRIVPKDGEQKTVSAGF